MESSNCSLTKKFHLMISLLRSVHLKKSRWDGTPFKGFSPNQTKRYMHMKYFLLMVRDERSTPPPLSSPPPS